jgi:hypothetical protein
MKSSNTAPRPDVPAKLFGCAVHRLEHQHQVGEVWGLPARLVGREHGLGESGKFSHAVLPNVPPLANAAQGETDLPSYPFIASYGPRLLGLLAARALLVVAVVALQVACRHGRGMLERLDDLGQVVEDHALDTAGHLDGHGRRNLALQHLG